MARAARPPPVFVTDAPAVPSASNPELEQQLRETPDDAAVAQVYADWLTERGDPRGELAMAQLRGDDARVAAILEANGGWLAGVSSKVASIAWRPGRFGTLRFSNEIDSMSPRFDMAQIADRLLSQPAASCLEAIAVGVLRWDHMPEDLATLLADAAARPFAPWLRRLHLGDCTDVDNAHHRLGELPDLSAFERLESLVVWGYQIGLPPGLRLPRLERLAIRTCALWRRTWAAISAAELPALRELEVWFGSTDYGAECDVSVLADLLEGRTLASVERLGLMNAEFSDDIAAALVASPILERLRSLDLSMGTLNDGGADVLLAARDRWRHLERLDVSESFLSDDRIAALSAVGPTVVAGRQKQSDEYDYRYVSVSE